ncbi:MAG: helix-turn-helix domain-containing protein [Pseudonocardiaceae bacterium]
MQDEAPSTTSQPPAAQETAGVPGWRDLLRAQALQTAMHKRAGGVPTYTVPEAAALMSISQEYLYRLIHAGVFPAVRMRLGENQGRYVIPAKAVETLLHDAAAAGSCVEVGEWSERWTAATSRAGVTGR